MHIKILKKKKENRKKEKKEEEVIKGYAVCVRSPVAQHVCFQQSLPLTMDGSSNGSFITQNLKNDLVVFLEYIIISSSEDFIKI